MSQIRTITIDQYPEDAILTLFSRHDLAFESVSFINRPYTGTVEYQEFAYRLSTAGLDAIIASGAIHSTRHLSVQHERLGDDIVRLVEAIAPESLEILELIDVGLTDEGVARLAQLPQLSRITTLSLACNELSAAGVELLTKSTWLKNVRHLDLGSNPYNPYYGFLKAQPIGDAGIAALAKSELITQLHTLHIINADISAVGIATLAQTRGVSNLRHLDLSFNFIGTSGCEALAKSTLLPSLRELHLSRCALDDLAIHHLMQSDFHNLRVLDLSYNSVSEVGVQAVASTPHLASLWHLNLHDNFIGDAGLMSLTKSLWLDRLVELDVEQDVWNYRRQQYSHESAISLAQSTTLARLDALWAGVVDEYHFERLLDPFKRNGTQTDTDLVIDSKQLRPEVRYSLQHYREPYDPSPEAEARRQALEKEYKDWLDKYTTPESQEADRRHHDFRTRPSDMST